MIDKLNVGIEIYKLDIYKSLTLLLADKQVAKQRIYIQGMIVIMGKKKEREKKACRFIILVIYSIK